MRRRLRVQGLVILICLSMASAIDWARSEQRLLCVHDVTAPNTLAARAAPDAQSQIVGSFPAGACGLQIVGPCADGFCEMSFAGVRGFVDTRKVVVHEGAEKPRTKPQSRSESPGETNSKGGRCVTRVEPGDMLRIRTGPSPRADEVGAIPPRACGIEPAGDCQGSWCRIVWRGRTGWVNSYYLD